MRLYKILWPTGLGLIAGLAILFLLSGRTMGLDTSSETIPLTGVTWQIETVDTSARGHSSLAVDSSGYPHISYEIDGDGDPQSLKYIQWTGSEWAMDTVAPVGLGSAGTSLALDGNGYPQISYAECNMYGCSGKYAEWTGGGWSITGNMDGYGSLIIDSNEEPHISYRHGNVVGNISLKYAHRVAGVWISTTVESDPFSNRSTSLKLDGNEYPHISYYKGDALKYAYWSGSDWVSQTVDNAAAIHFNLGQHTSMVLDTDYDPHIAYYDGETTSLRYAEWVGTEWVTQTVDNTGDAGKYASLAMDNYGFPHISYYDTDTQSIMHAQWTGNAWHIRTIESGVGDGGTTNLVVDNNDRLHLSYYYYGGTTDHALRYAWGDIISYTRSVYLPFIIMNAD